MVKTHPLDKTVKVLKNRFGELSIDIENDGEIYVENQPPHKFGKHLPIITNLGYFISKLTIDGQEWVKEYSMETKPIAFILEPKYDYEVDIPNILYHTSPIRFKDKILKYGLIPKTASKLSNHPERIYLTDNIKSANMFGEYLKEEENNEWYKNGYCIYSVKGEGIEKLYSDINFRKAG